MQSVQFLELSIHGIFFKLSVIAKGAMSKVFIYLDESGDLGKHGSRFFTVAALCTKEPKQIENMIKHVRERKLKKKLKNLNELKGNNSSPEVRKHVLSKLAKLDCSISVIVITKEQILNGLFDAKHKLYNYIAGLLIRNTGIDGNDIELIVDKKDSNKLLQADLNSYLTRQIAEKKLLFKVTIIHKESHCCRCLQAVDFIAWSVNRKYSFDEDVYYRIIEPKIDFCQELRTKFHSL